MNFLLVDWKIIRVFELLLGINSNEFSHRHPLVPCYVLIVVRDIFHELINIVVNVGWQLQGAVLKAFDRRLTPIKSIWLDKFLSRISHTWMLTTWFKSFYFYRICLAIFNRFVRNRAAYSCDINFFLSFPNPREGKLFQHAEIFICLFVSL